MQIYTYGHIANRVKVGAETGREAGFIDNLLAFQGVQTSGNVG